MTPPISEPHGDRARLLPSRGPRFSVLNVICALATVLGTLVAAFIVWNLYAEGVNFSSLAGLSVSLDYPGFIIASIAVLLGALGVIWWAHHR